MNRNSKLLSMLAVVFALALAMALAGCGQQASSSAASSSASSASASAASTSASSAAASASSASASDSASASSASASAAADEITFTLKVDATDADKGVLFDQSCTAKDGATVYDALVDTGLDLSAQSSSGSAYVEGIEGVNAADYQPNGGWMFSVNGKMPSETAANVKIANGDEIVWTFYKDASQAG